MQRPSLRIIALFIVFAMIGALALNIKPAAAATAVITNITCQSLTAEVTTTGASASANITVSVTLTATSAIIGQKIVYPIVTGEVYTVNVPLTGATPGAGINVEVFESFSTPTLINITGLSIPAVCPTPPQLAVFDPGDGRVEPHPVDRLAIYCNRLANPATLDIWGITDDSKGFRLTTLVFADLLKARNTKLPQIKAQLLKLLSQPDSDLNEIKALLHEYENTDGLHILSKNLQVNGKLDISVDAQNNFYVAWSGGPFGANGQGSFAKAFKCNFAR
jgi:hypothetical protein